MDGAGPIRAEPGNVYYELAAGGANGEEVKYWESWTSITSLYRHMFTSPTVLSVFLSEPYKAATLNQTIEGPFKVLPTLLCTQGLVILLAPCLLQPC